MRELGDPSVLAIEEATLATINLIARQTWPQWHNIALATTLSPRTPLLPAAAS